MLPPAPHTSSGERASRRRKSPTTTVPKAPALGPGDPPSPLPGVQGALTTLSPLLE